MISINMVAAKNILANMKEEFITPRSLEPDKARREFILNILLAAIIIFLVICLIMHFLVWEMRNLDDSQAYANDTFSLAAVFSIFVFFAALLFISRKGHYHPVSYIFIFAMFSLAAYMGLKWGVDVNVSILFHVILIIMSSILVSTRFSFLMTALSSLSIFIVGYLQAEGIWVPNSYWKTGSFVMPDAMMYTIIFFIIAAVSWLSNHEIEKSLVRARQSEAELMKERDSLEEKVEKRTRELKEIQAEKMVQLYRFAEFGRLSSGLFHDLINPLNAVALNIEKIKTDGHNSAIAETKEYMDSAISATKKMEDMVIAVRKQISRQKSETVFSIDGEIREVIDVLRYKARAAGVGIDFACPGEMSIYGDAIKFNQVVLNLISNALDAYPPMTMPPLDGQCKILVSLGQSGNTITLTVRDNGAGIPEGNLEKIFEPFFTTKDQGGMGIGLSMVKRIVEKDFHGSVRVASTPGKGSTFTVTININGHRIQANGRKEAGSEDILA